MDKNSYVVFGSGFDYCEYMCKDMLSFKNCQFINKNSGVGYSIYKIFHNRYANKILKTNIGYGCLFDKKKLTKIGFNHFVFFDSNPLLYDEKFLQYIRKKIKNSKITIIFVNTMATRNMRDIQYFKSNSDLIFTIDANDARLYDFIFLEGIHSKVDCEVVPEVEFDVTFAGADKKRGNIVKKARDVCLKNNLTYAFTVVGMKDAPSDIKTIRIPYEKVLEQELKSKCILEVCVGEQNALTLRAIEAIMYDKFLITNNKNIVNCTYYNEDKMKIFESEQDLEKRLLEIKSKTVRFEYKGEFSPITLFKKIREEIQKES
ncbi:MAG: hypothetical protein IKV61_00550 [Clostridia bacterium]|nr:hypothetical protein [Clostridia bacterium]